MNPAIWNLGSLLPGDTAQVLFQASNTAPMPLLSGLPEVWAYAAQPDLTPYNNRCYIYFQQSLPEGDPDNDGIPTAWELEHGLDPIHGDDALADPDHDGQSNLHEYLAGTDPRQANSLFGIAEVLVSGANLKVRVPSATGRFYGLERNRDLPWLSWEPVTNGVPGTGGLIDLVDPGFVDRHRNTVYRAIVGP